MALYTPNTGHLVVAAYARLGIHRAAILSEHMINAQIEANLMQATWANLGPLLWTIDQQTVPLVQGTASYTVPNDTVMMLDVWYSLQNTDGTFTDRIITPLSRTEYGSIPDKTQQGSPTSFWFDRLIAPSFSLWPVPDGTISELNYFRFSTIATVATQNAATPTIPYLWLDAFVAGLAHRLSRIYRPEMEAARKVDATESYTNASMQGVENVSLYLSPVTSSYWRI